MRYPALRRIYLVLGCAWLAMAASAHAAEAGPLRWEGAIVVRPAQLEIDIVLEVETNEDGDLAGYLSVPTQGVERRPLESFAMTEDRLTFVYSEASGDSTFTGTIAPDGKRIEGRSEEKGQSFEFHLEREPEPASAGPPLEVLEDGRTGLREWFDAEQGAVRLVMILSPTCHICKVGARLVQRYVLDEVPAEDLRVMVLWEPVLEGDDLATATAASGLVRDPRVTQLWSPERVAGKAFQATAGFEDTPAWDVFLVFASDAAWPDDGVPTPEVMMHNTGDLPAESRLDAARLAERIEGLTMPVPLASIFLDDCDCEGGDSRR